MHKIFQPLRVLLAEDNPDDAALILRELRRSGFQPEARRVETERDYLAALDPDLDIILSDYCMPQFSGMRALELLKERRLDIPFIIISGTIGEETAVAAMRSGATDYLLKDRPARLGQAVQRVLDEKRRRRERKEAEETFERLRRHHQLILDSAGEGVYGLDLDGNIIFGNPKAAELLGWDATRLLGQPAHATLHHSHHDGSDYPIESCPILASMRDGTTRRVTNDVFWRKDGTAFRVDYVCAPIKDSRGQTTGTIVTFKDNTEQYAAEMRLKIQEQQYRLLFEINPNPMWVSDARTLQILAVNQAAIAQYGYSCDEFLQLKIKDLQAPGDEPSLIKTKALSSSEPMSHFDGEFRHLIKDGSSIQVEIYSSPIVWEGKGARIVSAIDVTERRRAERRLREQAEIINRAHDAVIVRDFSSDRVMVWNNGAERLYGWSAEEAIGRSLNELIITDPKYRETLSERLISSGEFHGESKHRAKDGHEVIVESRVTLIRDDDGTPRAVLGINTDITERKKLETQLLRAQRLESIGTLASGIAHDLNNILTPILMSAEALRDTHDPRAIERSINLIEQSARRGANVVKQVLTFARGIEGRQVTINPRHLLEEMADIARKTFPKMIEITIHCAQDLWSVMGDPTQLHQVLLNLSVNARDAMPHGGSLTLTAENITLDGSYTHTIPGVSAGPHVLFQVSDTGTGMSREVIDQIFDPFFTTKEVGKGTGLGLSTTLGIVQSHGGYITVESEPGRGSTFKIFLPAANAPQSDSLPTRPELTTSNSELILLVDDEEPIRRLTRLMLEKSNYRVLEAGDAQEALSLFKAQKDSIDLVISDMMLPRMHGTALIQAMREMDPQMIFVASSGHGDTIAESGWDALNIRGVLAKPYDRALLLQTVRDALSAKKN